MARSVTVSLHVGVHKTATTHLQKLLTAQSEWLMGRGVRFLGPEDLRLPGRALSAQLGLRGEGRREEMAPDGVRRLVVSEENTLGPMFQDALFGAVYPNADLKVEKLVAAFAPWPVRLFVGLRDPAGWMASAYRHRLFNGGCPPFAEVAAGHDPAELRWSHLLERLRRVPGVGDIYVWRQEDYPRVAVPVLRRMVGWKLGPQMEVPRQEVNVGLSQAAVDWLIAQGPSDDPRAAAREARQKFPVTDTASRFDPWPEAVKTASRAAYRADIGRIAQMEGVTLLRPQRGKATGP